MTERAESRAARRSEAAETQDGPVFVDPSGRRRRRARMVSGLALGAIAVYLGLVATAFLGGPDIVTPLLPKPPAEANDAARHVPAVAPSPTRALRRHPRNRPHPLNRRPKPSPRSRRRRRHRSNPFRLSRQPRSPARARRLRARPTPLSPRSARDAATSPAEVDDVARQNPLVRARRAGARARCRTPRAGLHAPPRLVSDDSVPSTASTENVPPEVHDGGPVIDARPGDVRTAGPRHGRSR